MSVASLNATLEEQKRLKYDAALEGELRKWMASVLGVRPPPPLPSLLLFSFLSSLFSSSSSLFCVWAHTNAQRTISQEPGLADGSKPLQQLLKDGSVLCRYSLARSLPSSTKGCPLGPIWLTQLSLPLYRLANKMHAGLVTRINASGLAFKQMVHDLQISNSRRVVWSCGVSCRVVSCRVIPQSGETFD
jgi:hypothetical protein